MRRQQAFTLIEILVVVALVGMLAAYGMTTYGRFEARSRTEMVAKELITYIRQAQMYARNGDRGPGGRCNVKASEIAAGKSGLKGWQIKLDRTADNHSQAKSVPWCTAPIDSELRPGDGYSGYELPDGFVLYCGKDPCSNKYLFVRAIFGNTVYGGMESGMESDGTKDAVFTVKAEGWNLYYHFALSNGAITSGGFCEELDGDCQRDEGT